jgi:hypothetical protein
MSASQRVQVLADKAEELSLLAEFLKNPKLIEQLQDEVKKLNSLTSDEEAKIAQARKDLREHTGKMDILQTTMEELAKAQEAHKERVSVDMANIEEQSKKLSLEKQSLADKAYELAQKDKSHAEERKQLDAHAADVQRAANAVNDGLAKRESAVKIREDKVSSVEIALAAQKKKLDDKLKLLSE